MTQKLAHNISLFLCKKGEIEEEDIEIYQYGFEVLLDMVLESVLLVIIGVLLNKFLITVCFMGAFVILRSFAGGYHADTKLKCIVLTVVTYGVNLVFTYLVMDRWIYILIATVAAIIIWTYAPVQHADKPLEEALKKRNKIITRILLISMLVGIFILSKWMANISSMLSILLAEVAILIFMGRRTSDVKDY